MAEITKIKLSDGNTYDIVDTGAREKIELLRGEMVDIPIIKTSQEWNEIRESKDIPLAGILMIYSDTREVKISDGITLPKEQKSLYETVAPTKQMGYYWYVKERNGPYATLYLSDKREGATVEDYLALPEGDLSFNEQDTLSFHGPYNAYINSAFIRAINTEEKTITVEFSLSEEVVKNKIFNIPDANRVPSGGYPISYTLWCLNKPSLGIITINEGALSLGMSAEASGYASMSLGYKTQSIGPYSFSEGNSTQAIGGKSHAEGSSSQAIGSTSHAEGYATTAGGNNSHSEGSNTMASGDYSHAEGYHSVASGENSHSEGFYGKAIGNSSHAEGHESTASGDYSHAEGYKNTVSGQGSHAEGYKNTAEGANSHAEGAETKATGKYAHSEGKGSGASGSSSHAEGQNTVASGNYSHAEGMGANAIGASSHAEGKNTTAYSNFAHAEGNGSSANGESSHAEGIGTITTRKGSHAQGLYNIEDTDKKYLHIVGNGDASARSNAHTLDWDGNAWFAGFDIRLGGTGWNTSNVSIMDKINGLTSNISQLHGRIDSLNRTDSSLMSQVNYLTSQTNTNQNQISTIIDKDYNMSMREVAQDEISKIVDNAPETLDTLREVADWIAKDENGTTAIIDSIKILQNEVSKNQKDTNNKFKNLQEEVDNKAIIDNTIIGEDAWSSKNIIDALYPSFETTGTLLVCNPVEGYPLKIDLKDNMIDTIYQAGINLFPKLEPHETTTTFDNNEKLGTATFKVQNDGSILINYTVTPSNTVTRYASYACIPEKMLEYIFKPGYTYYLFNQNPNSEVRMFISVSKSSLGSNSSKMLYYYDVYHCTEEDTVTSVYIQITVPPSSSSAGASRTVSDIRYYPLLSVGKSLESYIPPSGQLCPINNGVFGIKGTNYLMTNLNDAFTVSGREDPYLARSNSLLSFEKSQSQICSCKPINGYPLNPKTILKPKQISTADWSSGIPITPGEIGGNVSSLKLYQNNSKNLFPTGTLYFNQYQPIYMNLLQGDYTFSAIGQNPQLTGDQGYYLSISNTETGSILAHTTTKNNNKAYLKFSLEESANIAFKFYAASSWENATNQTISFKEIQLERGSIPKAEIVYEEPNILKSYCIEFDEKIYYGGEYDWTTGIFKATHGYKILTGEEGIVRNGDGPLFYSQLYPISNYDPNEIYSTHFTPDYESQYPDEEGSFKLGSRLWFKSEALNAEYGVNIKNYFTQQYNNKTPVIIVYKLRAPEYYSYTPNQIYGLPGLNYFESSCGNTSVSGKQDITSQIEELRNAIISLGGNL